jgi:high-affinity Fe2+/Pb2+ permease
MMVLVTSFSANLLMVPERSSKPSSISFGAAFSKILVIGFPVAKMSITLLLKSEDFATGACLLIASGMVINILVVLLLSLEKKPIITPFR